MASDAPVNEQSLVLSGSSGSHLTSARAGFLPIALARLPATRFDKVPFYLRTAEDDSVPRNQHLFTLYRSGDVPFTDLDHERLLKHGVKFVYIRMSDQARFRQQVEAHIVAVAADPRLAISEKSAIIYETSVELTNELLADPRLATCSPRTERISRAITTLVLDDPTAFSHLYAASHHDFYSATHMVNVATYMVPLAHALGYHDLEELTRICQAGLLHDIGKVYISEDILNKSDELSDADWDLIRRHPDMGDTHLAQYEHTHPLVITVVRQHHERLDGSGYPDGLLADQIDPVSKICAVVDSFDAMTAFRPFKTRTVSVSEALAILKQETPTKYDPDVMAAWLALMDSVAPAVPCSQAPPARPQPLLQAEPLDHPELPRTPSDRRDSPRSRFDCPARVHILDLKPDGWRQRRGLPVVVHNISRSGVGALSKVAIQVGERVRIYVETGAWERSFVDGQTVRCRSYRDGWYEIGMQFLAPPL